MYHLRFAQSSKNLTKSQHHPEDAQREAGAAGELLELRRCLHCHGLGSQHHTEPRHHPMRNVMGA